MLKLGVPKSEIGMGGTFQAIQGLCGVSTESLGLGTPRNSSRVATPLAWYKCLNSRNAQKCLRRVLRSLGTTPISGKTLSERKGHSRSSRRVPGYSRSSSRNWKFHSRNTKFHSRNGLSRLDQYETHNSRSNSRSDSRNCREPT